VTSVPHDAAWEERVRGAVERLAATLREAVAQDKTSTGSPVYSHLVGLEPVDWRGISTARARYFSGVLDDWQERLLVARKRGWPGDILTLADDAPTRYHREQLLLAAAKALIDLCRFDAAKGVLRDLLDLEPDHLDAQCQLGLTLNRLGELDEAEVILQGLATKYQGDPEAHGILGRVYKDLWRARWDGGPDLEARQRVAVDASHLAAAAADSYAAAQRLHLGDYYTGINVVSLAKLLEHLEMATGRTTTSGTVRKDLEDLASVVRVAAAADREHARGRSDERSRDIEVWARATQGELALLVGEGKTALRHYQAVVSTPGVTGFQVSSMLAQVELLERLGFRPQVVGPVYELLRAHATPPPPGFRKVAVASGHMTDAPGRAPRFPPAKEPAVREAMAARLDAWRIGAGDLALCGAARGADLLFAELCLARGAHVRLLLPLPEGDFLRESVRLPDADWEERYFAVKATAEVWSQRDRLGRPPEGASAFARNNLWLLNTARVDAPPPPKPPVHALLVWDEQPTGDGPDGTAHFAQQIERLGGLQEVVNPTKL
jgi:hypothetical protein